MLLHVACYKRTRQNTSLLYDENMTVLTGVKTSKLKGFHFVNNIYTYIAKMAKTTELFVNDKILQISAIRSVVIMWFYHDRHHIMFKSIYIIFNLTHSNHQIIIFLSWDLILKKTIKTCPTVQNNIHQVYLIYLYPTMVETLQLFYKT